MNYAVCLLVINKIETLPLVAINSILKNSEADIYVGYVNIEDISNLPSSSRLFFIDLNRDEAKLSLKYQNFGTPQFYRTVTLKWDLFLKILDRGYDFIIYNDVDVIWLRDAGFEIKKLLSKIQRIELAFQSFTRDPAGPLLCMGFFAFRNSEYAKEFVVNCMKRHKLLIEKNQFIGDDEIVTEAYEKSGFSEKFWELPQSTFAVGNLVDLYSHKTIMPHMHRPKPIIFHANFVVGVENKIMLLSLFLNRNQRKLYGLNIGLLRFLKFKTKKIWHIISSN